MLPVSSLSSPSHGRCTVQRLACLFALTAALAGCGGGGGGDAAPAAGASASGSDAESPTASPAPAPTSSPAPAPASAGAPLSATCTPGVSPAEALARLNEIRAQPRTCGTTAYAAAPPLQWNAALAEAAEAHSADMAGKRYFSHTGQDGSTPASRAQAAGYPSSFVGENISAGSATMEIALADWLQSPGHCANLMRPDYREYGIGCAWDAASPYKTYWTQLFGTR